MSGLHLWQEVPRYVFQRLRRAGSIELFGEIRAEISPELTGVGYIIGPRIAGFLFAGGCLSYFVLDPDDQAVRRGAHRHHSARHGAHQRHGCDRGARELRLLHWRRRGDGRWADQPSALAADDRGGARRRASATSPIDRATATSAAAHRSRPPDQGRARRRAGAARSR